MTAPNSAATKALSALVALVVVVSVVTLGGVAQTTQSSDASAPDAEPNDSMANATHVEYNETIEANLSSGSDVDYYAVNASAGDGIIPRLHLQNSPDNGAITVQVVSPSGQVGLERSSDQMGGPSNVAGEERPLKDKDTAFAADTMESDGTYYVRVKEYKLNETEDDVTYEYNLSVETTDLDEHDPNENASTATQLDLGTEVDAVATGFDHDVYAVNLEAGQNYTANYEASSSAGGQELTVWASAPVDADEYVGDYKAEDGERVTRENVYGMENVNFSVEEDGTYYVVLSETGSNADLLGKKGYTFAVTEAGRSPDLPPEGDADDDGLSNEREQDLGTDPKDADTDGDGLTDGQEVDLGSDPLYDNTYKDQTKENVTDTDGDGLADWLEGELGTDPEVADTDGDGIEDDYEIRIGSDPTDPDSDDDGTSDGEEFC